MKEAPTSPETSKSFKYWQMRTIIATMIGYAVFYFVRKNFSFAIPGLTVEYGITKTSFGIILTLVTIVYGLSRFLNGVLADRMNARYHMSVGLLLCAIANFAFGWGADLSALFTGQTSGPRSEEHTSELQSRENLVCRLLLEKK